jgi:hypothetical protein
MHEFEWDFLFFFRTQLGFLRLDGFAEIQTLSGLAESAKSQKRVKIRDPI